jgi:hypothetical protein
MKVNVSSLILILAEDGAESIPGMVIKWSVLFELLMMLDY